MGRVTVTLYGSRRTPYGDAVGEIQIDGFKEEFHVSTDYWAPQQYEQQWRQAFQALASGASKGCLITSLDDPGVPGGRAFLWLFYRDGADIAFQNMLLLLDDCQPRFVPSDANKWVPARETVSEDGDPISEWRVSFANLETLVKLAGED